MGDTPQQQPDPKTLHDPIAAGVENPAQVEVAQMLKSAWPLLGADPLGLVDKSGNRVTQTDLNDSLKEASVPMRSDNPAEHDLDSPAASKFFYDRAGELIQLRGMRTETNQPNPVISIENLNAALQKAPDAKKFTKGKSLDELIPNKATQLEPLEDIIKKSKEELEDSWWNYITTLLEAALTWVVEALSGLFDSSKTPRDFNTIVADISGRKLQDSVDEKMAAIEKSDPNNAAVAFYKDNKSKIEEGLKQGAMAALNPVKNPDGTTKTPEKLQLEGNAKVLDDIAKHTLDFRAMAVEQVKQTAMDELKPKVLAGLRTAIESKINNTAVELPDRADFVPESLKDYVPNTPGWLKSLTPDAVPVPSKVARQFAPTDEQQKAIAETLTRGLVDGVANNKLALQSKDNTTRNTAMADVADQALNTMMEKHKDVDFVKDLITKRNAAATGSAAQKKAYQDARAEITGPMAQQLSSNGNKPLLDKFLAALPNTPSATKSAQAPGAAHPDLAAATERFLTESAKKPKDEQGVEVATGTTVSPAAMHDTTKPPAVERAPGA